MHVRRVIHLLSLSVFIWSISFLVICLYLQAKHGYVIYEHYLSGQFIWIVLFGGIAWLSRGRPVIRRGFPVLPLTGKGGRQEDPRPRESSAGGRRG